MAAYAVAGRAAQTGQIDDGPLVERVEFDAADAKA
jgi:hypothetical protein